MRPDVEVFDTQMRGLGLRARSLIPEGTLIIEYIGIYIPIETHKQALRSNTPIYGMETGNKFIIDSTTYGNQARFINHSCQPNAIAQKWVLNKSPRIIIIASSDIQANEEITINYGKAGAWNTSFQCLCQSKKCQNKTQ